MAKSEQQKQLEGTARKDRKRGVKGDAIKLPPVPTVFKLSPRAKKIYRTIGNALVAAEVLSKVDVFGLAILAINFDMLLNAYHQLLHEGMTQTYKSGAKNVTVSFTAFNKFQDQIKSYFKFYGLTPYHRERILTYLGSEGEQGSELDKMLAEAMKEFAVMN